jgi:hypothetical protein
VLKHQSIKVSLDAVEKKKLSCTYQEQNPDRPTSRYIVTLLIELSWRMITRVCNYQCMCIFMYILLLYLYTRKYASQVLPRIYSLSGLNTLLLISKGTVLPGAWVSDTPCRRGVEVQFHAFLTSALGDETSCPGFSPRKGSRYPLGWRWKY